jgi:hypothetical protein
MKWKFQVSITQIKYPSLATMVILMVKICYYYLAFYIEVALEWQIECEVGGV